MVKPPSPKKFQQKTSRVPQPRSFNKAEREKKRLEKSTVSAVVQQKKQETLLERYKQTYGERQGRLRYEYQETLRQIEQSTDPREQQNLRMNLAFILRDLKAISKSQDKKVLESAGLTPTEKVLREQATSLSESEKVQQDNLRKRIEKEIERGGLTESTATQIRNLQLRGVLNQGQAEKLSIKGRKIAEKKAREKELQTILGPGGGVREKKSSMELGGDVPVERQKTGISKQVQTIQSFFEEQVERVSKKSSDVNRTRVKKIAELSKITTFPPSFVREAGLSAAVGFLAASQVIVDPIGTAKDIELLGRKIYSVRPNKSGVPQIYPDPTEVSLVRQKIVAQISSEIKKSPVQFVGKFIGGTAFDVGVLGPATEFALRPVKNIVSQFRLRQKGAVVGTVKGTPGVSYFQTAEGKQFILVENIHPNLEKIPGAGDITLTELRRQTKAGTGEKITTGTFARGALAKGTEKDKFLIRSITEHYGGIRSAGLFASPELKLKKDLTIITSTGKEKIVKAGETVGVASKEFASDLATGTTPRESVEFVLRRDPNALLVAREAVKDVSTKGKTTLQVSKDFFGDEFSGSFAPSPQAVLPLKRPTAREREILAQAQRVSPFEARGTIVEFSKKEAVNLPVFTVKELKLPFGLETPPLGQELYEAVGFGRIFKDIKISEIKLSAPQEASKKLPDVVERPRVAAIIREPSSGKILFVKEGEQQFLFPGGGVDPTDITSSIGKEKVKLGFPSDVRSELRREVFEETGLILGKVPPKPTIEGVRSKPAPLRPLIGAKGAKEPAFIFQDVAKVFEAGAIIFRPKARGEITEIGLFTPKEALARKDIGIIERSVLKKITGKNKDVQVSFKQPKTKIKNVSTSDIQRRGVRQVAILDEATVPTSVRFLRTKTSTQRKIEERRTEIIERIGRRPIVRVTTEIVQRKERGPLEPRKTFRENLRFKELYRRPSPRPTKIQEKPRTLRGVRRPRVTERIVRPPARPREGRRPRPIPFPATKDIAPRRSLQQRFSQRLQQAFAPVTRIRGKTVVLSGRFTRKEATGVASRLAKTTLRASYGAVRVPGRVTSRGLPGPTGPARVSKRTGLFIEPRRLRLSTLGEKSEIQEAKRRRGRGFF